MSGAWLLRVVAAAVVVGGWALVAPGVAATAEPREKGVAVSGGYLHTCAVTARGAAVCWGYNHDGELGNDSTIDSARPVRVYGLGSKVKAISSGNQFSCALTTRGKVWCWGYNGRQGQLGNGSTVSSLRPVAVVGLGKVKAIDAGYYHACAITSRGALKCWGSNQEGQLGIGSRTDSLTPVSVPGLTRGVKAVSASYWGTCALTSQGAVKCWGYNNDGELGDGTTDRATTPVGVHGLTRGVKQVSYGYLQACAVTSRNAVKCWGLNDVGQLGNDATTPTLVPVGVYGLNAGIRSVQVGGQDACVLTLKGRVKCWGANWNGQLGDNSTTNSLRPVAVYDLGKARAVTTGFQHTCVVTARKSIKCWGSNEFGELGDNTTADTPRPVRVYGF